MHENRETSSVFPQGDRSGKAECRTPDVYAGEESDRAVIPMKQPNKGVQATAEVVEGRARTKENTRGGKGVRYPFPQVPFFRRQKPLKRKPGTDGTL
jgi:hypothetical protein